LPGACEALFIQQQITYSEIQVLCKSVVTMMVNPKNLRRRLSRWRSRTPAVLTFSVLGSSQIGPLIYVPRFRLPEGH
jgi:hypothetical protein